MSHTVASCKKCKGFRRKGREIIKPTGPCDLHSVETMRYLPAFKKLCHFPLKKLPSMLPRENVTNARFHQLQWVMDTMINLKKGDSHVSKATKISISLCIFFAFVSTPKITGRKWPLWWHCLYAMVLNTTLVWTWAHHLEKTSLPD